MPSSMPNSVPALPTAFPPQTMDAAQWLAAIVESSDDAIVSKNLDGIITSWNKGAERIFGWRAEEIIGRSVLNLIPPELHYQEVDIIARLKRHERIDHFETTRARKDGTPITVSLTISPIKNAQGQLVGASKVARDITEQRRALEQLAKANEELRRADRMKSEFLAVMSHELRTPLNSIIGFASVLRQDRRRVLDEDQKKQLHLIHASGKHLLNLINDVLDLSRIEAGRTEIEPEEFSADEAIQEAVRSVELLATNKRLQLRCDLDAKEPVYTDRKRLTQVVLNLLSNAIKFTARGTVTVQTRRDGSQLVVTITDTGIGIGRADQELLFRPFSQVEGSTRRRYEGTGLGLYLCKKLVRLLGGDISLSSELGRGATFSFHIPVRVSAHRPEQSAREAAFA